MPGRQKPKQLGAMKNCLVHVQRLSGEMTEHAFHPSTSIAEVLAVCAPRDAHAMQGLPDLPGTSHLAKRSLLLEGRVLGSWEVLGELVHRNPTRSPGSPLSLQLICQTRQLERADVRGSLGPGQGQTLRDRRALRIAVVGASGVGKSSLVRCCGDPLMEWLDSWDLARLCFLVDKEAFVPAWMSAEAVGICWAEVLADIVVVLFDLTDADSFQHACLQLSGLGKMPRVKTRILLGNKMDLDSERQVSQQNAQVIAAREGLRYFEISALHGLGVEDALRYAVLDAWVQIERCKLEEPLSHCCSLQ